MKLVNTSAVFFHDGRAANLVEQVAGPLFSGLEMGLADKRTLMRRIVANPAYVDALTRLLDDSVFSNSDTLYQAIARCIASFERSAQFSTFDSKYDRYLRGEYTMTAEQERGRIVFFSSLINCNSCHVLNQPGVETFTDYSYHNIGVPTNLSLKKLGVNKHQDLGLLANPAVTDAQQGGKFKVPTLRNIAVTGPYMHNGAFRNLRTVLMFYNQYIIAGTLNPETGEPWRSPEVDQNISTDLLRQGQPINEHRLQALAAFLKTLTDSRYEHLLLEQSALAP